MKEQIQNSNYFFEKAFDVFEKKETDYLIDTIYYIDKGIKLCIEKNEIEIAIEWGKKEINSQIIKDKIINEIITALRIMKKEEILSEIIKNPNIFKFEDKHVEKAKIVLESLELENPEKLFEKCIDQKIQIEKRIEYGKDLIAIYAGKNNYKKILEIAINDKIPNEVKDKAEDSFISHYLLKNPEILYQMLKKNHLTQRIMQKIKDTFNKIELLEKGEFKKEIGSRQDLLLIEISQITRVT